ncbi:MAG: DinB family protein [Acidobacteriota bacterium]
MDGRLRDHILELLEGKFAHIDLETALSGFPLSKINTRLENAPHTAWELLEHIRLAQWDILEFSRDAKHVSPDFPDGYWNKAEASPADWQRSIEQVLGDLESIRELVRDKNIDLFAKIHHGDGQTILREALLVADHNAYHLGQLMLLRRVLAKQ